MSWWILNLTWHGRQKLSSCVQPLFVECTVTRTVSQGKGMVFFFCYLFSSPDLLELKALVFNFVARERAGCREGRRKNTNRGKLTALPVIAMLDTTSATWCLQWWLNSGRAQWRNVLSKRMNEWGEVKDYFTEDLEKSQENGKNPPQPE